MITCDCLNSQSVLPTIPKYDCFTTMGQIQKIAFQMLRHPATGNFNSMTYDDAELLATWQPLLAATDATKIVMSPFIEAPTSEVNTPIEFGGGNDTIDGIPYIVGYEPVQFTGMFRGANQERIAALKKLSCFSLARNLGVYLIDSNGSIECINDGNDNLSPIPIYAFSVSDKGHGGKDQFDWNAFSWRFKENYSDQLQIITRDRLNFDPLTQL